MSTEIEDAEPAHIADELRAWLRRDLFRKAHEATDDQLDALLADTASAIKCAFARSRPLMPREVAKQLLSFSRHITGASIALQKGGEQLTGIWRSRANTPAEVSGTAPTSRTPDDRDYGR